MKKQAKETVSRLIANTSNIVKSSHMTSMLPQFINSPKSTKEKLDNNSFAEKIMGNKK